MSTHRTSTGRRIVLAACTALLTASVAACTSEGDGDSEDKGSAPQAPAYTVANKSEKANTGRVDLILPGATVEQAEAAIRDYARGIDGPKQYWITVVRSDADKTYVCDGRWIKDADAAQLLTGGTVESDTWPALKLNCPDPKG